MGQGKGNGTRRPADVSWSKFSRENTGRMGGKEGTSVPRGLREQGRVWPSPYKQQQGRERSLWCAGSRKLRGGRCGLEGSGGLARERMVK